jgi:hypothetical protein
MIIQILQEFVQFHVVNPCNVLDATKLLHVTSHTLHLILDEETGDIKPFSQGFVHGPMAFDLNFGFHVPKILETPISFFA